MNALERQLNNDEPKCANCDYWSHSGGRSMSPCEHPDNETIAGHPDNIAGHSFLVTTDLSVCSKWERKSDGKQTEAEAGQA